MREWLIDNIAFLAWCTVFPLIGALIGRTKGLTVAGIFWGLCTGPIGLIVLLFLPDTRVKCSECGKVITTGEVEINEPRKCPDCGCDMVPFSPPKIKCKKCKYSFDKTDGDRCPVCGETLE